ncbi:MAG: hypothetical protein ACJA0H_000411 [Francisellaceae bacterium]|jgi:hypothetical protein
MKMIKKTIDGIKSLTNKLANTRNSLSTNELEHTQLDYDQMNAGYKSGIGNKIIRLKAGYSLSNTLQFENEDNEKFYNKNLAKHVKNSVRWMLAFGRGVILIQENGKRLDEPLQRDNVSLKTTRLKVFDGEQVSPLEYSTDIESDFYMRPKFYSIRGTLVHHSRVIDFSYVPPVEKELPAYRFGGISEIELIYNQLVNDGVVERSTSSMLEKSSSFFYKIKGFSEALENGKESVISDYIAEAEAIRGMHGAGVIDSEDDVLTISQSLTNLAETDIISLRRLAMVTGLPITVLVGEGAKGLNSAGLQERQTFRDTIEQLQNDYEIEPINEICSIFGLDAVKFKDNQNVSPMEAIQYDDIATNVAVKLNGVGEDASKYLSDKNIIEDREQAQELNFAEFFKPEEDEPEVEVDETENI